MKLPSFLLLFLVIASSKAQTNDSLVARFLTISRNYEDIAALIKETDKSLAQHPNFDYVPTINPLNPERLKRFSSHFGKRFDPFSGEMAQHLGLDISAKAGTPIHAAASGVVKSTIKSTSKKEGYGNQVVIEHRYGFKTRYAHMYLFVVEKGQTIIKGDIIGYVGSTGKSTANHIHYEILKNGKPIDPYPFCFLE